MSRKIDKQLADIEMGMLESRGQERYRHTLPAAANCITHTLLVITNAKTKPLAASFTLRSPMPAYQTIRGQARSDIRFVVI